MQPGSLLECIAPHNVWHCLVTKINITGPGPGDVFIHDGDDLPGPSGRYIFLQEYPHKCMCGCGETGSYPARYFREIQPPVDIDIEFFTTQTV